MYTSLQCHYYILANWLAEPTYVNSSLLSAEPSLMNSRKNLTCPSDPEDWKQVEGKFSSRWTVPHSLGALDKKPIVMKKPMKSGSEYYNYKGFFPLVLLAMVDTEYRFLLVDVGSSGSSSDAQIFNHSRSREKIEDDTLGLLPPEPLGEGGPDLHYFLLGDDAFALMPWMV